MSIYRALVVDDEPDILELLEITLGRMDIDTDTASNLGEARNKVDTCTYDLCLTDMRLPDGNGIELVKHIQKTLPELPVAVITAHGSMESAVQALKAGAFDFVSKPVDLQVLRNIINTTLKLSNTRTFPEHDRRSRDEIIGDSKPMQLIRSTVTKLARSQAPVYISGESGTGKELVAKLIHEKGPRADRPFIPVNCGAIPADLMESEFFGHKKGSFTGAVSDKDGLFQAADGGTLFLDEVAELPLHMQVKLLRAIQEKSVRPVGAQQEVSVDVRILSATHKDLTQLVEDGNFRQDLYYRLNVIELKVPSLRDRCGDIPQLIEHLLQRIAQLNTTQVPTISDEAMTLLQDYRFPGNVRELENILERATTLCENNHIQGSDLRIDNQPHGKTETVANDAEDKNIPERSNQPLEDYLGDIERSAIINALEKTRYNKTAAAKLLGITFRALRYRLKKLGLE